MEVDGFGLRVEKSSAILFDKTSPFSYEKSQTVLLCNLPNSSNKKKRTYKAKIWLIGGKWILFSVSFTKHTNCLSSNIQIVKKP